MNTGVTDRSLLRRSFLASGASDADPDHIQIGESKINSSLFIDKSFAAFSCRSLVDHTNLMRKNNRSKQKTRGSGFGRHQINTQINTQDSEGQINTEDSGGQMDSGGQIITQIISEDSEDQINTQDCQINSGGEMDSGGEDSEYQIKTQDCEMDSGGEIIHGGQIITQEFVTQGFDCCNEDGVLYSIISSLTLREAIRTCVLSHRWKHIWTHLPVLTFSQENILDSKTLELYENFLTWKDKFYILLEKTDYFIQVVNSVLQQHGGCARIQQFTIRYFLHKAHSNHLDAWVRFAVASKTKLLYLHLRQPHSKFRNINIELYDFPLHLLASSAVEKLYLVSCTLKPPYEFDCLNRLRSLVIWYPGDTGEDINHLVSHCSSLDRLDFVGSKELVILNIPHSLSQLVALTVKYCDHLKEIRVDAVNLFYISYKGVPVDFLLRQPSCVKQARVHFSTEGTDHSLNFYLTKLANELPHLKFLYLNINGVFKVENLPKCSPSFSHLCRLDWDCREWLEWRYREWGDGVKMSLLHLDTLLDAAPILEQLKLQLSICVDEEAPPRVTKLKKKLPKRLRPRPHLKSIEITGFYFGRWQVLIVLYLLTNAVGLESLTIEKGAKPEKKGGKRGNEISETEISETDMKSLIQQVPPNVKLVIL